ncbi:MAG: methionine--tRNA ligase [Patescibacteria group bacterium]
MKTFYVTTPIYYVNDQPHVGHAYTTLMADILARYYRSKLGSDNVWFLTGTDEHGAKIQHSAEKNAISPKDYTDKVSAKFRLTWDRLEISNNDFIRTTEPRHELAVNKILQKLKQAKTPAGNDAFYEKDYQGLYCVGCESYIKEADLINGLCPAHQTKPELVKEKNWFFRLSDFTDLLQKKIKKGELEILPKKRKNEVLGLLKLGLEDLAISRRRVAWGIKVPWDLEQTVYVWVEALLNYITALGYGSDQDDKFKRFWPVNLQLIGKDILKFHAVIWPAILTSINLKLPDKIFAHGYFTIDGQKMSKTLGNVIDPNEMIDKFGAEASRYLIVSQYPFGEDGDIKADLFAQTYNADLANGIGNLSSRILAITEKYFHAAIPNIQPKDVFSTKKIWKNYRTKVENLQIYEAIKEINSFVQTLDRYIAENKPWELAKAETQSESLGAIVYNLNEALRQLAWMIYPIMPQTSQSIFDKLGISDQLVEFNVVEAAEWGLLKSGTSVSKGSALFPRI